MDSLSRSYRLRFLAIFLGREEACPLGMRHRHTARGLFVHAPEIQCTKKASEVLLFSVSQDYHPVISSFILKLSSAGSRGRRPLAGWSPRGCVFESNQGGNLDQQAFLYPLSVTSSARLECKTPRQSSQAWSSLSTRHSSRLDPLWPHVHPRQLSTACCGCHKPGDLSSRPISAENGSR